VVSSHNLVVFDALMLRCLLINDNNRFPDELAAFRTAFQNRRFRVLMTNGILEQYLIESNKPPQFQPLPILNKLATDGRAIRLDEHRMNRSNIQLAGLPQEHREFIHDALAARASHLITNRQAWLDLSPETERICGLQIVSPVRFLEMEG